jgi:hypothetical protein
VLDTVFVIADGEDYDPARGPEVFHGRVPDAFVDVTLRPLARAAETHVDPDTEWSEEDELRACGVGRCAPLGAHFRLYRGATPEKPVNGMFSFSPCRPIAHPEPGFARPGIEGPFVNPALNMGFRQYPRDREVTEGDVNETWRSVANQVLAKGFLLGTRFDIPA